MSLLAVCLSGAEPMRPVNLVTHSASATVTAHNCRVGLSDSRPTRTHPCPTAQRTQHTPHARRVLQTLVAVMPATDLAAGAVSAVVRALQARHRMALVRFALQANSAISLGALVPVPGFRADYPDHFVLCRVPWANDYRRLTLPAFENVAVRTRPSPSRSPTLSPCMDRNQPSLQPWEIACLARPRPRHTARAVAPVCLVLPHRCRSTCPASSGSMLDLAHVIHRCMPRGVPRTCRRCQHPVPRRDPRDAHFRWVLSHSYAHLRADIRPHAGMPMTVPSAPHLHTSWAPAHRLGSAPHHDSHPRTAPDAAGQCMHTPRTTAHMACARYPNER